jgi:peptidyl-prolyl cis-trans isomerase B (cyclophilin B)
VRRALAIASICLAAAAGGCGDDDSEETARDTGTTTAPPAETQPRASGGCEQATAPETSERKGKEPGKGALDEGKTYRLTFATSCGEFTIELDQKAAPNAAASLVGLAEDGYFDNTVFHRIVPGFVIQGGDPTATGSGGPGYSTEDEPPADARYTRGVVAMAKTGEEPPGTAGSQFFVVVGEDAGLPPDYAVVGKVGDGMDVVERIGEQGDPATEQPTQTILIEKVTVEES